MVARIEITVGPFCAIIRMLLTRIIITQCDDIVAVQNVFQRIVPKLVIIFCKLNYIVIFSYVFISVINNSL